MTHLVPSREELFFPLQKEFDKLFNAMFGPKRLPSLLNSLKHSNYPRLDIIVMNGSYRIEAAVPGVEPNDIKVEILPGNGSERLLKISGRMAKDYLYSNDVNYEHRELSRLKFQRVITLPEKVQGDPEAIIKNGILTLTWEFKKDQLEQVKEITVKSV